jgi:YbbR domain-containing protein
MMKLLTRNLGWKLLSLAIAVALWIIAAREPEVATTLSLPIEFKNIPDDLDIGGNLPDRVRLEVRGPTGRLSRDNLADAAVVLDLSDARGGERTYTIRSSSVSLPFGVVFYRAVPSQVTLRFDQLITRSVDVRPIFVKTPDGYRVGSSVLEPAKVWIRGPEERVNNISQVMTDPVDLTGVVSQKEFRTRINVGDPLVRLEAPEVTLKVTLERGVARGGL